MNPVEVYKIKEDEIGGTYSMYEMYIKFIQDFRREFESKRTWVIHRNVVE
jgi:hypothetical protein